MERRKPDHVTEHLKKYCDFLIGDPHKIDALQWKSVPDSESLLVLGRSETLEGYDHGHSWYKVRIRDGRAMLITAESNATEQVTHAKTRLQND
jgi:hypothetical protein